MSVVHYEQPAPLPASEPGDELAEGPRGWVARLRGAAEYANYIAATEFVPEALRGKPDAIAAAILYGAELGLEPMQSLRLVAMIRGRPSLTAEGLRALVTSKGHELWFEETTVTRCVAAGRRAGTERVGRITWTLDDAKRAGIGGGENWRRYPAEMLRARATAALARALFADVITGIPAAEELEGEPDNGPVPAVTATPPPESAPAAPAAGRTRQRRAAARPPVAPTPPPDPQPEPPLPEPEPPKLATEAQRRLIFALMRDVGFGPDRDQRLAFTRRIVDRPLASSNELTIDEARRVIDELLRLKELPASERQVEIVGRTLDSTLNSEIAELERQGIATESTPGAAHGAADAPVPPAEPAAAPATNEPPAAPQDASGEPPDDDIPF